MFEEKISLINQRLINILPKGSFPQKELFKAADYSLNSPGKRIRPLLVLTTLEVLKKDIKLGLDPACALELIHTYSFIHDDLPCMDNDDFRRGKKTLHKAFNEWLAVLTGDYLLTYSFEIIAKAKGLDSEQKVELIKVLSECSGGKGLIAGQVVDLSLQLKDADYKTLEFMDLNKTAALFIAAVEFASIIAKIKDKERKILKEFAKNLGFAFQVIDDILDAKVEDDQLPSKVDVVSVLGIDEAKKLAKKLTLQAEKSLRKIKRKSDPLLEITKLLLDRKI
ncbi:MAG: polyprenyl synthetase family protein [Chlamydiae bacterium]|nr:polyprenyl synthetase family protein [Chlamydiota bacterium]